MELPAEAASVTSQFLDLIDASAPGLVSGLYLHGSLSFGEYFPGQSDVDFAAVLSHRPDEGELESLAVAHAAVATAHPLPHFDGIHLLREDLAGPPEECPELPVMFEGNFSPSTRNSGVNPVTWHELARQAAVVRGPALTEQDVWTDDAALRAFTHANLSSYWAGWPPALAEHSEHANAEWTAAWCVLGVSRLHHLLATGAMTSKSGAGRYAISAFGPQWQHIATEALRIRELPAEPSLYADPAERGRDVIAFASMAIDSGLALGSVAGARQSVGSGA